LVGGVDGQRWGTAHPSIVPYQAFATQDGHILIAAGNDQQYVKLCQKMGVEELAKDGRFLTNKDRVKHRDGKPTL
jgi:crotonobetainyl-CoA:carnitine CoA-transferase CaiB-like acyl-CoA transferase